MVDSYRDAFQAGQAALSTEQEDNRGLVADTLKNSKQLWLILKQHESLLQQAGYGLGRLDDQRGEFQLFKGRGYAMVQYWADVNIFYCRGEIGKTPDDAAKRLLYLAGCDAISLSFSE